MFREDIDEYSRQTPMQYPVNEHGFFGRGGAPIVQKPEVLADLFLKCVQQ